MAFAKPKAQGVNVDAPRGVPAAAGVRPWR